MTQFNKRIYDSQLKLNGLTNTDIANKMGLSTVTLWRKTTRKSEFTYPEIVQLAEILHVQKDLFFNQKVS